MQIFGRDNYGFSRRRFRPITGIDPGMTLHGFRTFDEMQRCAEDANDTDLKGPVRAQETYSDAIRHLIEVIKACASDTDHANQTLVTAHKIKGLEFGQVRLADDFLGLHYYPVQRQDPRQEQEQLECEINLVDVVAARALKRRQPNPKLKSLLSSPQETCPAPFETGRPRPRTEPTLGL
jgi:hypothetical protein